MSFMALVTDKDAKGVVSSNVTTLQDVSLPEGDVLVAVEWAQCDNRRGDGAQ